MYPVTPLGENMPNPYINDFMDAMGPDIVFINQNISSRLGIFSLAASIGKLDIVFLNWIEDLPDRKWGIIQSLLFLPLLWALKLMHIRVFYTLHNRSSHFRGNRMLKKLILKWTMKHARYILCHAKAGLDLFPNENIIKKMRYLPHPVHFSPLSPDNGNKKTDILIWGSIRPYKGIHSFLRLAVEQEKLKHRRIHIIGRIDPAEYAHEIQHYRSDLITIENRFAADDEIQSLIRQSRLVLFTYSEESVLSSGALSYSLALGANVVGPDLGSFSDMYREKLIGVFRSYEELPETVDSRLQTGADRNRLEEFLLRNTWQVFGRKVVSWIECGEMKP